PAPAYGYPGMSLVPWATPDEAACALGICLAQEGLLDDATGQYLLTGRRWKVPEALIPLVWKRLKLHFAYPQAPLGLRAYIKRLVRDLSDSTPEGSFWDNAGNEYLSIRRAAKELGVHKTTLYRAIQHGQLMTEDGTPVMQSFAYQVRSGIRKTVQAIARSAIDRQKQQDSFDEQVIQIIRKAHGITCASAKRAYKRLKQRLEERLGSTPEPKEIQRALCDDPHVRRWGRQRTRQLKR